jgi:uncharacterized protein (UPF0332 family)
MFDPKKFHSFSDAIIKAYSTEEVYRTSISRSYYAAILYIRDKLLPTLKIPLKKLKTTLHTVIPDYFSYAHQPKSTDAPIVSAQDISRLLISLKEARFKADYDTQSTITKLEAQECWADAQTVMNKYDTLAASHDMTEITKRMLIYKSIRGD